MVKRRFKPFLALVVFSSVVLAAFQNCGGGFEGLSTTSLSSLGGSSFNLPLYPSLAVSGPAQIKTTLPSRTLNVAIPFSPVLFAASKYFGQIDGKLYYADASFKSFTPVVVGPPGTILNGISPMGDKKSLLISYVEGGTRLISYGSLDPVSLQLTKIISFAADVIYLGVRSNPTNGDLYILTNDLTNSQFHHYSSATKTVASSNFPNQLVRLHESGATAAPKIPVKFGSSCGTIAIATRTLQTYGTCGPSYAYYSPARDSFLVITNNPATGAISEISSTGVATARLVNATISSSNNYFALFLLNNQLQLVSAGAVDGVQPIGVSSINGTSYQNDHLIIMSLNGANSRSILVENSTGVVSRNDSIAPIANAVGVTGLVLHYTPSRTKAAFRVTDTTGLYRYGVLDFQTNMISSQFSSALEYSFSNLTELSAIYSATGQPLELRRFATLGTPEVLAAAASASLTRTEKDNGSFEFIVNGIESRKVIDAVTSNVTNFEQKLIARENFYAANFSGSQRVVRYAVDRARSMLLLESYDYEGRQSQTAQVALAPETLYIYNGYEETDRVTIFRNGSSIIRFDPVSGVSNKVSLAAGVNAVGEFKDGTVVLSNGQVCPMVGACSQLDLPAGFTPTYTSYEALDRMILSSGSNSQKVILARNATGAQVLGQPFAALNSVATSGNYVIALGLDISTLVINVLTGTVTAVPATPSGPFSASSFGRPLPSGNFAIFGHISGTSLTPARVEIAPATAQIVSITPLNLPTTGYIQRAFSLGESPAAPNTVLSHGELVPNSSAYTFTMRAFNPQGAVLSVATIGTCTSLTSDAVGDGSRFYFVTCHNFNSANQSYSYQYYLVDLSGNTSIRTIPALYGSNPAFCQLIAATASLCVRPKNGTEMEFVKFDLTNLTQTPVATLPNGFGLSSVLRFSDKRFMAQVAPTMNYSITNAGQFYQSFYSGQAGKAYIVEW